MEEKSLIGRNYWSVNSIRMVDQLGLNSRKFLTSWTLAFLMATSLFGAKIEMCQACKYSKIEDALSAAQACDTIYVGSGEYRIENVKINKSISIIGLKDATFISQDGDEIFTILADHTHLEGLTFRGVKTNYLKESAAIRIKDQSHFSIIKNRIEDCFFGVYVEHSKYGIIQSNVLEGQATHEAASGNGIHAWYSSHLEVEDNLISGHRDGIYLEFVNASEVTFNKSTKNKRYGLHFMFSNDDVYSNNVFEDNGVGVAVMFSKHIKMYSNRFSYNWGRSAYGLLLKEINDALIYDNVFEHNTMGIFVEGANRIDYFDNTFQNNGWAIKVSGGCSKNIIYHNNFVHNSLDLEMGVALDDNEIHHNYWGGYSGYDLDRDGIGDIPHFPVQLFSYILSLVPESIVLFRSFFMQLINYSEKISPVFTPKEVKDLFPLMKPMT